MVDVHRAIGLSSRCRTPTKLADGTFLSLGCFSPSARGRGCQSTLPEIVNAVAHRLQSRLRQSSRPLARGLRRSLARGLFQIYKGQTNMPVITGKFLPLTKGYRTLVSPADFDAVANYKWSALVTKQGRRVAAVCGRGIQEGYYTAPIDPPNNLEVDHKNGLWYRGPDYKVIDYRRSNLRLATGSQNQHNRGYNETIRRLSRAYPGTTSPRSGRPISGSTSVSFIWAVTLHQRLRRTLTILPARTCTVGLDNLTRNQIWKRFLPAWHLYSTCSFRS